MAKRVQAHINPKMLTWAREDQGYSLDEAADLLRVSVEKLREWESDERPLFMGQLEKLASKYRRPMALFFMSKPPSDFEPLPDFRTIDGEDVRPWSPELRTLIRRVKRQQREYLSLREALEEPIAALPGPVTSDDAEVIGQFIRDSLGVTVEQQREWRTDYDALREWVHLAEEIDILVVHTSTVNTYTVPDDEMLGFSLLEPVPVVVLNGGDRSPRRRTFTLLHELAHLFLHSSGVCDLHDSIDVDGVSFNPMEVKCNAVAAAALMPKEAFLSDSDVAGNTGTSWDNDTLRAIGQRFSASREAVLRRLLTLNRTTRDFYRTWRDQNQQEFKNAGSEKSSDQRGPDFHQMRVRELGYGFVEAVLEAYYQDVISVGDAAQYLDVKLDKLEKVSDIVYRRQSRWAS